MAVNIFNATMDVLDNNQRAYDTAYNRTDKAFKQQAARKAGTALASGDRQGAMQAMGGEGELDAVRQMQLDQGREDQQAYSNKRQQGIDEEKRNADLYNAMKDAFTHVAKLPTPQERREAMKHPIWGMAGIPPEQVDALPDEAFGDAGVKQFADSIGVEIVKRGDGYDVVEKNTGNLVRSVEPTQKPPGMMTLDSDGNWTVNPTYVKAKGAVAAATRAPKGGGGGRGAGLPPPPAGWKPKQPAGQ